MDKILILNFDFMKEDYRVSLRKAKPVDKILGRLFIECCKFMLFRFYSNLLSYFRPKIHICLNFFKEIGRGRANNVEPI